jgi:hypothetical protein
MLSINQINQWKNKGYLISKNIINKNLTLKCTELLNKKYYDEKTACKDFGSKGELEFFSNTILDQISVNLNIINCVKQLLNTNDILLIQSDAWGKAGKNTDTEFNNNDQRMHMDYGNNTFLHPSDWNNPECVAVIIYFSDTDETGGKTAVVPRNGVNDELYQYPYINMPGQNKYKFYNDKNHSENYFKQNYPEIYKFRQKLYNREIFANTNVGDILFYRLDTWHRGTPVKKGKVRNVMNLLWKKKECHWINSWNPGFSKKMYYGNLEKFIESLNPEQRATIGFPLPGDKYWDSKKIKLLKFRYPNINIKHYLSKL